MRVLITGGRGFIGAWTARVLLQGGHDVRTFDVQDDATLFERIVGDHSAGRRVVHVHGDITDAAQVDAAVNGCDAVVHLAAVLIPTARRDPLLGARINVMGTLHVFEAAKRTGVRGIAYASSAAVFGPDDGLHPEPHTHYGAYKLCNEGCARAYWEDAGIRSVGLRPATVYGPGREIGVTADPTLAMRAAAEGQAYAIRFTGATGMDYVEDVARIFARAATATPDGAHVFSLQGQLATMDEVLAAIRAVIPGAEVRAEGAPLMFAAAVDEAPLHALFPGVQRTPLADGTRATIDFYRVAVSR
ncbi:nucleoside-diphosphate sugar epimerase [Vulcanimicrobium alpinum]|uniref:Nucleoside-diphosphate sugar epimerase n=1 Tax=Vulcanimicrobium alpinum TaxID=3016050 RepID=A0AAN1XWN2_UNVUL|nr:NAD(P)-dependent oxidoreductase [Vulcanimicrobium alpinum]BDE06751.1 nucleoside-diphosphate sugar epimerase [Vulcanimicrobium alpinum]